MDGCILDETSLNLKKKDFFLKFRYSNKKLIKQSVQLTKPKTKKKH
jgi:hypothetical protein